MRGPCILASGPLTSPALSEALAKLDGEEHLFFYDAISPIIDVDSIDMEKAFRANRRDTGSEGDYINCALNKDEYETFIEALVAAERIELEAFEKDIDSGVRAGMHQYFEGCMPVEIMAARGKETLAFGPIPQSSLASN